MIQFLISISHISVFSIAPIKPTQSTIKEKQSNKNIQPIDTNTVDNQEWCITTGRSEVWRAVSSKTCITISKQLDEFRTKLQHDIKALDDKVTEALNTANANKVAIADNVNTIKRLERELVTVNRKCNGLEILNDRLTAQQEAQES